MVLAEFVREAGAAREIATKNVEMGAAAAAARLIQRHNPNAVSFAPIVADYSEGAGVTGMVLRDADGKVIEEIEDYNTDESDELRWRILDYARVMGKGADNSWWAVRFGTGDPFNEFAYVEKAVAWSPDIDN